MTKDSLSLFFICSGIFLTFYNLGSAAKLATLESQPTLTAQVQEK